MAKDTRRDGKRQDQARPQPKRAPYQRPAVAWEEEFAPVATSSLNPGGDGFGPPMPRE